MLFKTVTMIKLVLTFGLFITTANAQMGMAPPQEPSSDLVPSSIQIYKTVDSKDLKVHIFNPMEHKIDDSRAALLFYHGGGFRRGSPIQGYEMSEVFNPEGVVIISVEYRLTNNDTTLDELVADARSSVKWVRTNAEELGIDPEKIITSGHSSGAYLAYAAGAMNIVDNSDKSSNANAMILWTMEPSLSDDDAKMLPSITMLNDYQPATYVDNSLPPSIFIHGSEDRLDYKATMAFQETIKDAGNLTGFNLIEGADHFFREPGQKEAVFKSMLDFLTSNEFID